MNQTPVSCKLVADFDLQIILSVNVTFVYLIL